MTSKDKTAVSANAWSRVLRVIEARVNAGSFDTWFRPTSFLGADSEGLHVQVPNQLFKAWLVRNYSELLQDALQQACPEASVIVFEPKAASDTDAVPDSASPPRLRQRQRAPRTEPENLNSKYTFSSFVVGSCNQLAHAAARAVAEEPSRAYNPLFLYGGVGLGKTHLMHAIGHYIKGLNRNLVLSYVTSETFMNELVNSIRYDRTAEFRDRYRSSDVLLIDDIQFLAGKERTQVEFFHTFNALHEAQKQIIISSDSRPRSIPTLEERLHSRFEWGLIADIQPPDLETKIAILKKKAEAESITLSDDVVLYIATKIRSNIRELEGALIRLVAFASLTGREIDLDFAQEILDSVLPDEPRVVSVEQIIKAVSEFYGLKHPELKTKTNRHAVSHPRQIAMFLAKQLTTLSFPQIGRVFGGKHHTTVIHSVNVVQQRMLREPDYKRTVHSLLESLQ